ncbi:MAG: FtsW/RodA/SpoVE family cell cycle protein [Clostridiales bacterium]|nr:FtsW/RodA/SpoVE family cell cycle protein [Clostridiales bacterium]
MKTLNEIKMGFSANRLLIIIILFIMLGFCLLSFSQGRMDAEPFVFGSIVSALFIVVYLLMLAMFKEFDRPLFLTTIFLLGLGLLIQFRMSPKNAKSQLFMLGIGVVLMFLCMGTVKFNSSMRKLTIPIIIGSLAIMAALLVIGKESGGAKNWIIIGGRSFQPSEFVKIATAFVLAHYLDTRTKLLKLIVPLSFAIIIVFLLVVEKDLGAAMLIALTCLIMYFAATGNLGVTLAGLGMGALGAILSYRFFDHVKLRVEVWQNPWITYDSSGYQIVQGLMAIASGGLFGSGLGLGSAKVIPAYHTDYIFAVICEEFGIIAGVLLIAFYVVFIIRGLIIALNARNRFLMLFALGCTTLITLQSFIIIGGVIKLIPLTGITLPFISFGGSSMIASMISFGFLQGIAADSKKYRAEAEGST